MTTQLQSASVEERTPNTCTSVASVAKSGVPAEGLAEFDAPSDASTRTRVTHAAMIHRRTKGRRATSEATKGRSDFVSGCKAIWRSLQFTCFSQPRLGHDQSVSNLKFDIPIRCLAIHRCFVIEVQAVSRSVWPQPQQVDLLHLGEIAEPTTCRYGVEHRHVWRKRIGARSLDLTDDIKLTAVDLPDDYGDLRFVDVSIQFLGQPGLECAGSETTHFHIANQWKRNFPVGAHRNGQRKLRFVPDINREQILRADHIVLIRKDRD